MNPRKLKKTLADGGHVFGCMLSAMASTRFAGALAGSTLDYAIIDTEHTSRDREETRTLCRMLRQADITPVVRVPIPKSEWVAMALDAGAAGVLIPYCETIEEVQAVAGTARWHPLKGEHLRRASVENKLPSPEARRYLSRRHRDTFAIIGIESEPAYQNLEAILEVPGVDAVFVGPNDMSTSLGVPDQYDHPRYLEVVEDIIRKCERNNVPVMVHQQNLPTSKRVLALGARFVLHSTDAGLLQRAMQSEMNGLREAAGLLGAREDDTVDVV